MLTQYLTYVIVAVLFFGGLGAILVYQINIRLKESPRKKELQRKRELELRIIHENRHANPGSLDPEDEEDENP